MPKAPNQKPHDEPQVTLEVAPAVVPEVIDQTPKPVIESPAVPVEPAVIRVIQGWEK
jgi:hypothetical protein